MSLLSLALGVRPDIAIGAGLNEQGSPIERARGGTGVAGVEAAPTGRPNAPRDARRDQPVDTLTFSPEALDAAARIEAEEAAAATPEAEAEGASPEEPTTEESEENPGAPRGADGEPLSDAEVEQVRELQARDLEVRQHEQAHVAAGGPYVTSGPNYEYQQGPDGKRYAVGGSVGIDTSAEDTPEKTIAKAQVVRQAALAPAEPSAQDLRVAAQASQLEQQARAELSEERREETQAEGESAEMEGGEPSGLADDRRTIDARGTDADASTASDQFGRDLSSDRTDKTQSVTR